MKISKYVSLSEVVKSNTAIRKGIDNTPTQEQLDRITLLAEVVFDQLREWVGDAVKINSGFRSPELNKAIGGAGGLKGTSQHCANNGAAFDIDDTFGHATNSEMFHYIKDNLVFDQLIWEFGDDKNPDWVHVSYKEGDNRMQILVAKRNSKGKAYYVSYDGV
jgi:hypothetical protein